jgi:catechol 2,3-dioxygenase-like lactoylglutathione lyase family enzyme
LSIGITVSDLDRTCGFFSDVFGFVIDPAAEMPDATIATITGVDRAGLKVAYAHSNDACIELLQFRWVQDKSADPVRINRAGRAHIAFFVEDLDAVVARAASWGWHAINPLLALQRGAFFGWRICYLVDCDGVTIELAEKPAEGRP